MAQKRVANPQVMKCLLQIFQNEMAGIMRYLHYSFMIMGHNRIPIQKWFRDQAIESMDHSVLIGEKITSLGGHPPLVSARTLLQSQLVPMHTEGPLRGLWVPDYGGGSTVELMASIVRSRP